MKTNMKLIGIAGWLFAAVSGLSGEITWTNLPVLITTTISTNVASGDNSSGCNLCYDGNGTHKGSYPATWPPAKCQPYKAATERWTITNVTKTVILTMEWNGKPLMYQEQTLMASSTNKSKLHVEWKTDQAR